ncbi:uncharacterized protein [Fopius arisanus]|uniref:F-box domain-containing protein n=3 Tax=Fopius arisanus TaxID=64838 RepID=A0A9R1TM93_9HYME|nr:PREDICTED: uncharacterized protein LOC105271934 [Fopius arisanus]
MEFFGKLMRLIGVCKPEFNPVVSLPVEITQNIFRMLDPRSLLNAAQVSRQWRDVCRGDHQLRATARRHIRREKRRAYGVVGKPRSKPFKITGPTTSAVPGIKAAPVIFAFGPSGICAGQVKAQSAKRRGRPSSRTGMAKSILKFR